MSSHRLAASSGTFENFSFWQILCDAHVLKFTGTLALIHPQKKKSLMFEQGKLVGTRSSLGEESTLQLLISQKKIDLARVRPLMTALENKESLAQLDVLVKEGLVEPTQMQDILDAQTKVRVSEIFLWKEGRFAFVPQIPLDLVRIPHSQETLDLVYGVMLLNTKMPTLDPNTIDVEASDLEYLLDSIRDVPFKLKTVLKRAMSQKNTDLFQKELKNMNLKEVLPCLAVLNEMKVLKIKKIFASDTSSSKNVSKDFTVKELEDRLKALADMDFYTVLQVKRNSKEDEIKKSFFVLAKQYHPDQLPEDASPEIKKLVSSVFALISQAHATLVDVKRRDDYNAQLDLKDSGFDAIQAEKILEAEMAFLRAEALVKKGDFSGANKELEKAVSLNNSEADYYMLYGWSLFKEGFGKKNTIQIKKGKEQLTRALTMKPNMFLGYYYSGLIAKTEENIPLAKEMFEKVLSLNPQHQESNSELRVINMRAQKGTGLKGFLQKKK